jgi:hypothetical protein
LGQSWPLLGTSVSSGSPWNGEPRFVTYTYAGDRLPVFTILFKSEFGRDALYAPIVALAVSLQGPFSPVVATHLSM